MTKNLYELNSSLKTLLICFLVVLSIGVALGILYIYLTTSMTIEGTEIRYAGDIVADEYDTEIDVLENYPKSFSSFEK